jgi:hypothetical protein
MKLHLAVCGAFHPGRVGQFEQLLLCEILAQVEHFLGRLWAVESKYEQL